MEASSTRLPLESPPELEQVPRVRIVDLDMPFSSMVAFIVKWALAAIPAAILLMVVWLVASAALLPVLLALLRV